MPTRGWFQRWKHVIALCVTLAVAMRCAFAGLYGLAAVLLLAQCLVELVAIHETIRRHRSPDDPR